MVRKSPSTITIMNCTPRWTSGWTSRCPSKRLKAFFWREKSTITIMNSTSRCSSRCPSRCAIHYGYRAWTFPKMAQRKKMLSSPRSVQWPLRPVIRGADRLSAEFQGFCCKSWPPKSICRTLEKGHWCHSVPPCPSITALLAAECMEGISGGRTVPTKGLFNRPALSGGVDWWRMEWPPRYSEIPPVLLGIPWPTLRGPLRNHFWKKKRPQPYWGRENSGNALEPSNALNCRVWGIPAVLSRGIPGNALRAFLGSFRNFSGGGVAKLRAFGKGVPDKAFHVEVPRGIPFEFCK